MRRRWGGPLAALFWAKLRQSRHAIASVRRESRLKVALVSVSTLLLWSGGFWLSRRGLRWLDGIGGEILGLGRADIPLDELVLARLLSLAALALLVLLVFSNILVAYATFYRSREVAYLIHAPLGWRTIFLGRFAECVSLSSWASAFLGSPLLLAYGLHVDAPVGFYLALLLVYVPFVTLPAAAGTAVTLILVRWLPRLRERAALLLAVAVLALGGLYVLFRTRLQLPDFTGVATLPAILDLMGSGQSAFLPSQWAVDAVLAAAAGDWMTLAGRWLLLVANAAFVVFLVAELAARWFHPGWSGLIGMDRQRLKPLGKGPLAWFERALSPLPEPLRSLLVKDIKLFWRDPAQWTQFVLFFGVLILYAANLRSTSPALDPELWQSLITLLNLVVSMLILATLTTRFIFPLISLEGRRFWILGLAPLTLRQVVRQKLLLSVGLTSTFTVALITLTSLRLGLDAGAMWLSLYGIGAANLALSGLAVGLGALYPNFREDNPSRIVSGLGGTLTFILSMVFVVLMGSVLTVLLQWPFLSRVGGWTWPYEQVLAIGVVVVAVLSGVTCLLPLRLGLRHLQRADF